MVKYQRLLVAEGVVSVPLSLPPMGRQLGDGDGHSGRASEMLASGDGVDATLLASEVSVVWASGLFSLKVTDEGHVEKVTGMPRVCRVVKRCSILSFPRPICRTLDDVDLVRRVLPFRRARIHPPGPCQYPRLEQNARYQGDSVVVVYEALRRDFDMLQAIESSLRSDYFPKVRIGRGYPAELQDVWLSCSARCALVLLGFWTRVCCGLVCVFALTFRASPLLLFCFCSRVFSLFCPHINMAAHPVRWLLGSALRRVRV